MLVRTPDGIIMGRCFILSPEERVEEEKEVLRKLKELGYEKVAEREIEVKDILAFEKDDKDCSHKRDCEKSEKDWMDCPFVECPFKKKGKGGKGKCCKRVWELGRYDPVKKVVEVFTNRIKIVSHELGYDIEDVKNVVRIHEHAHAFIHQKLKGAFFRIPKWGQ